MNGFNFIGFQQIIVNFKKIDCSNNELINTEHEFETNGFNINRFFGQGR